jgi:hypothetical protein
LAARRQCPEARGCFLFSICYDSKNVQWSARHGFRHACHESARGFPAFRAGRSDTDFTVFPSLVDHAEAKNPDSRLRMLP